MIYRLYLLLVLGIFPDTLFIRRIFAQVRIFHFTLLQNPTSDNPTSEFEVQIVFVTYQPEVGIFATDSDSVPDLQQIYNRFLVDHKFKIGCNSVINL